MRIVRLYRFTLRCLTACLVLSASTLPVAAQQFDFDSIFDRVREWPEDSRVVGLSIQMMDSSGTKLLSLGRTEHAGKDLVSGTTLFELGSITKAFTGTLLAAMVQSGEVSLDDPVAEHLPPGWTIGKQGDSAITLLHLATHTSGLPRMPNNFAPADTEDPYADVTLDVLRSHLAASPPTRSPGQYEYSNLGIAVLGQALAHRAGMPFRELLHARVIEPLGMDEIWYDVPAREQQRLARGHTAGFLPAPLWNFGEYSPVGGQKSTTTELIKVARAVIATDSTPIGQALTLATTSHEALGRGADSIGLGWHITHRDGERIVWHDGGTGGFRAFLAVIPESGRAVALLSNAALDWIGPFGRSLFFGIPTGDPPAVTVRQVIEISEGELETLVGEYQFSPQFSIMITREGDQLYAQPTGQQRLPILPFAPDQYFLTAVEAELIFQRDDLTEVQSVTLRQGGMEQKGVRLR